MKKASKLEKLSFEELKNGFQHCSRNAADLELSSQTLYEKGIVSLANSLLIVAIEELVKGIIYSSFPLLKLLVKKGALRLNLKDIENSLIDHKSKSSVGYSLLIIPQLPDILMKFLLEYVTQVKSNPNVEPVINYSEFLDKEVKNWFEQSRTMREKGFYVDLNNGSWITPKSINDNDYKLSLRIYSKVKKSSEIVFEEMIKFDWSTLKVG